LRHRSAEAARGGNKLGEKFIADAYADWCEHGIEALRTMRKTDPSGYVRVTAGILPDKLEVDVRHAVTRIERVIVDHRPRQKAAVLELGPTQHSCDMLEKGGHNQLVDMRVADINSAALVKAMWA
jgi:hypothetical protein